MQNFEKIKTLVYEISDIEEIMIAFVEAKNISEVMGIATALRLNRQNFNRLSELLDEAQNEQS